MRAFVAVPLEPTARREISAALRPLMTRGQSARWVREENLHLTVAFLGEIEGVAVSQIDERLAPLAGRFPVRRLVLRGAGGFPAGRPRVVWLGVDEGRSWFTGLARAVREVLEVELGFLLDRREPAAHVTVARLGRPDRAILAAVGAAFVGRAIETQAGELTLFASELGAGGPTYRVVRAWPFAAESAGASR